jgi:hypothetical protein
LLGIARSVSLTEFETADRRSLSELRGDSPSPRSAGDIAIYQRHCADHDTIVDRHTLLNHTLRPDIDARAASNGRLLNGGSTIAETPRDGAVRIDLDAGADVAMVPDCETAGSIEDHVGPDPATLSHFDIAEDQNIVVTGRAFAKSVVTSNFPTISQQITDRNMATKFFSLLAT